ncbi:CHASE2 domain-containing protein [Pusillimonas sp.]|uniref:CHASE2 domain-containing protein n=1 Tax=Pusillimonas sp. TaxID=3040095 RepID=UPI0037CC3F36
MTVPALMLLTFLLSYYSQHLALDRFDNLLYGRIMALAHQQPSEDIVIIALDDSSIAELGYWPWRRGVHAQLLERLGAAKAVGLDLVLSDSNPAYPHDDRALAHAISQHGRVVLPLVVEPDRIQGPLPMLAQAAAAVGFINVELDPDGVVRSMHSYLDTAHGRVEHFVPAMLEAAGETERGSWGRAQENGDPRLIAFAGEPGSFTMYPYARVLDGSVPAAAFEDKYVLVGAWAAALGDTLSVPLSKAGEPMAGVEILATGLHNALGHHWISTPSRVQAALLSMLPVLLVWLALSRLSPSRAFLVMLAIGVLIFIIDWLLMLHAQFWIGPSAALIGMVLAYPVWSWRLQEAALKQIDAELDTLYAQNLMHTQALPDQAGISGDRSLPARMVRLHQAMGVLRQAIGLREEALRFLSHDMRSPQNAILALTQLQRLGKEPLAEAELLNRIDRSASRTLGLVDGFVRLARAESMELAFKEIDLADLLQSVCDEHWPMAQHRKITLDLDGVRGPARVMADEEMLGRALGNLIANAIQYSSQGSRVWCRLQAREPYWVVEVQDTGRGMTPEQQVFLFEPFRRFDENVPDNPDGSGLGLAFVRAVVLRHAGRVEVDSTPGEGSVFRLRLLGLASDDAGLQERLPGRQ